MEIRISKLAMLAVALAIAGITLRLLPHTANFAPIGAIALFAGAILAWRVAVWLPLVIMVISDLIIGLHPTVLFTWGGFMLVALFGMLLRRQRNLVRIPLGAAGAAVIFFVVSNFGVWLEGKLYPPTWQGLADAYVMALPFLRTSFVADLSFGALLFGLYALAAPYIQGDLSFRVKKYRVKNSLES
jgi:uncharacterized protein DUF6580